MVVIKQTSLFSVTEHLYLAYYFYFYHFFSYYLIQEILICIHFWHTETLSFVQSNSQLSLPICLYGKTIILNDWPWLFVMKLQSCLLLNLTFIEISVHKADMLWLALITKDIWAKKISPVNTYLKSLLFLIC